ncbi:hypothetical protein D9758_002637 [Tetrapyrgos nigripes]|uniref:Cell division cycle protein 123 n=1 Tax=Tetrapyrgos nigripes TaxID=182062 RepID=A0A8H5GQ70_9AGAR|nr:hypothetical protein D9758_002637 [Tetrapyrgos nigripes]
MISSTFPPQSSDYILSFQFSSWYPKFRHVSIKSTVIRPLLQDFVDYMNADGVFIPEGSEDVPATSTLSDDENGDESDDEGEEESRKFAFPELNEKIRECIREYGAVFPKLNFSSPKDASWILPASSPLKCTSPSDVYLLLKSSDFITHDLSSDTVFEGCDSKSSHYELELVLRKWYPVDRSRELRCFVRNNTLIGFCQRDTNYYDFLNNTDTALKSLKLSRTSGAQVSDRYGSIIQTVHVFDILLTRDLSRAHVVDFNPYSPRTDTLLFTYEELLDLIKDRTETSTQSPELRVIDSRSHPAANSNAPANQHNMVPFEALSLSSGRDIEEFADLWEKEINESMQP